MPVSSGQTLSHYEIIEKLGEGATGLVFKARDLKLDRFVALKFLTPSLIPSGEARARFFREARAISALNHPNIAIIYDVDESEEGPFLVLEYLPGGTLKGKLSDLRSAGRLLSVPEAIDYALQAAEGLAHAHRHGIFHRDVKPGNLLFTQEGRLKVMDFGLSKFRGAAHLTQKGHILGTIAYMSPEQAQGHRADQRTDIFSFGIVLYEMIAGELPFRGEHDRAVIHQIIHSSPPPLTQLRPDVSSQCERIIRKALHKQPAERYLRMEEAIEDLRRLDRILETRGAEPAAVSPDSPTLSRSLVRPRASWLMAGGKRRLALAAGLAVMALALLVLSLSPRTGMPGWLRRVPERKTIAVLPFNNVGGDAANQAFCDGLAETLASTLSQLEQFHGALWVVPASEVRRQATASAAEARQAFGVNLVVTGSVQRVGRQVRLTVNLVDARTPRQLAAGTIDTPLEELATLQDRVVARVADLLEVELQPQVRLALAAGGTALAGSYDLYLQGRGYLQRYDKAGNLEKAVESFQKAIQQDPGYALAQAGLGEARLLEYKRTKEAPSLDQAREAAERAIELNARLSAPHVTLGIVKSLNGRYDEAVWELRRALDLDPVSAAAYRELAGVYETAGRLEEAEATYQKAIQLQPKDWVTHGVLGVFYYRHGRHENAALSFRRVIELTPDNHNGYLTLGGIYTSLGRYDEAAAMLPKSLALKPTPYGYSNLGTLYFLQGRYREAVAMNEKAMEAGGDKLSNNYTLWGNLADSYRWTPEYAAKAPDVYRRAIEAGERQLAVNPKDPKILSSLAVYWAKLGDKERATADIAKALGMAPRDTTVQFKSAVVYELSGQRERALASLGAGLKQGFSIEEVRRDPELAQLRKDRRYERVAADLSSGVIRRLPK